MSSSGNTTVPQIFAATSTAVKGFGSFANASNQARAIEDKGKFQKARYELKARIAKINAKDALQRGEKSVVRFKKQVSKLKGAQRASFAAQGVDISSGSPLDVLEDTSNTAADEVVTIRNNAWKEALGLRLSSLDLQGQGAFAGLAAKAEARNTIAAGGLDFLSSGLEAAHFASGGTGVRNKFTGTF